MPTIVLCVTNDTLTDIRVIKIAGTLQAKGFEVLITGRQSESRLRPEKGIPVKRFSLWFNAGPLFYAAINWRTFFFLLFKKKLDIIWSNDLDTLPACAAAAFLRRKPLVYDSHELFTEVPELQNRPFVRKIWELAERLFIRRADAMITVCDSIADYYHYKYGIQPEVIRNLPLELKKAKESFRDKLNLPADKKIVIYQGAVNLGRGIEDLLAAAHYLPEVYIVIAGTGDLLESLKQKFGKTKYSDRIRFTGRLAYDQLSEYTRSADLGVSLERNMGLNYYYALPNKLFDYIQARIPVLVSALPEMEKIVRQYRAGEILRSHDPEALAASLKKLLDKPADYFSEALEKAAGELNWQNEQDKIDRVLMKLKE